MIILGFSTVKGLATGLMLVSTFESMPGLDKNYMVNLWRRGLMHAALAKYFARRFPREVQDELYLAAMVSEVGHLVLNRHFGDPYRELLMQNLFPLPNQERPLFQMDHVGIGSALLEFWNFPANVSQLVLYHHDPKEYRGDAALMQALQLSRFMAYHPDIASFLASSIEPPLPPAISESMREFGLSWQVLASMRGDIVETRERIELLFHA
jgi:HD-like signal output (HDOD) protein